MEQKTVAPRTPEIVVATVSELHKTKHTTSQRGDLEKFSRDHVIILDIDDSDISLKDLVRTPAIKEILSKPYLQCQNSVALCIVTRHNIIQPNGEAIQSVREDILSLQDTYPGYFDVFLYNTSNPTRDGNLSNKKEMLEACKKLYREGTAFCYIGLNKTLLGAAQSMGMTPFHIRDNKIEEGKTPIPPQKPEGKLTPQALEAYQQARAAYLKSDQYVAYKIALSGQLIIAFKKSVKTLTGINLLAAIPQGDSAERTMGHHNNNDSSFARSRGLPRAQSASPPPPSTQLQQTALPPALGRERSAPRTRQFELGGRTVVGQTYVPTDQERVTYARHNRRENLEIQVPEAPLQRPASKTASLPFKLWLKEYFLKSPLISDTSIPDKKAFIQFVKDSFFSPFKALILIYGFDGYDPITNEISYAQGADKPEQYELNSITDFSPKLFLASFLGLPSRPIKGDLYNGPTITLKQIFRNFLGGIDWKDTTPTHKKRLQAVGFLVKGLLIPAVKVITWPFKVIINVFKLATEVAPWLATTLSYFLYKATSLGTQYAWLGMKKVASGGTEYRDEGNVLQKGLGWVAIPASIGLFVLSVALAITTAAIFLVHYICRVSMIVGRAITSPEKSVRMAYAYGSELQLPFASERVQRGFARVIGVFGAVISLAITAVTWAICFPLIINFIVNFMPSIASIGTAFLNWQPVVNSLTAAQSTVGAFLHSTFGPAIVGLTNFIGVQITYSAIIASIASLFVIPLTTLGDYLSNRWANWHEGGIFDLKSKKGGSDSGPCRDASRSDFDGSSPQATHLVNQADDRLLVAHQSDKIASLRARTPPVPQATSSRRATTSTPQSQQDVQAIKTKYGKL